jgi:hypothetical protein
MEFIALYEICPTFVVCVCVVKEASISTTNKRKKAARGKSVYANVQKQYQGTTLFESIGVPTRVRRRNTEYSLPSKHHLSMNSGVPYNDLLQITRIFCKEDSSVSKPKFNFVVRGCRDGVKTNEIRKMK